MKKTRRFKISGLAMLLVLAAWSQTLFALGFGNAVVRSYLGQPLNAQVQLISGNAGELQTVTARLASAADFEMMGLTRAVSVPLHFEVIIDGDQPYVEIISRLPISDPVVQLVVELSWSGGRMLREYTLFLDPPTYASKAPAPMVFSSSQPDTATVSPAPEPPDEPDNLIVVKPAEPEQAQAPVPAPQQEQVRQQEPEQQRQQTPVLVDSKPDNIPVAVEVPDEPEAMVANEDLAAQAKQTVTVPAEPQMQQPVEEPQLVTDLSAETTATVADGMEIDAGPRQIEPDAAMESIPESVVDTQAGPDIEPDIELTDEAASPTAMVSSIESGPDAAPDTTADTGPEPVAEMALEAAPGEAEIVTDAGIDVESDLPAESRSIAGETEVALVADNETLESDGTYGPVQQGETLWGIARRQTADSAYSINQAMLAIQRLNPEAFGGGNINHLKRGAILRLPTEQEIGRLTQRQAMLEAMRQEQSYKAMKSGLPEEDLPAFADTTTEVLRNREKAEAEPAEDEAGTLSGRLQLVPPVERAEPGGSGTGAGSQATGAVSSQEVEEVLARTEEELANARQENAYLNERIRELEAQISQSGATVSVEDTGLAEMEDSQREQRLSGEEEPALTVVQPAKTEPWYIRGAWWIGGLVLLLIAAVVWMLRRMAAGGDPGPGHGDVASGTDELSSVRKIRDEAEEILDTLQDTVSMPAEPDNIIDLENYAEPGTREPEPDPDAESEPDPEPEEQTRIQPAFPDDEAVELDSSDPEVKLDLARAYLSMGDKDAAQSMLEEVLEIGDEQQIQEARDMMEEL